MSNDEIIYAGNTEAGYEVLDRLLSAGSPVSEIVTLTREQAADQQVSGYYPYSDLATEYDADVYHPAEFDMDTTSDVEHFRELDADLLLVNGWQRLIPGEILDTFTHGALGVHGSAYGLPQGRGRSPMNWSLIEGLDRFLLSVIRLDEGVDSGGVLDTVKYDVTDYDDIRTLYYKLAIATERILLEHLEAVLAGEAVYEPQRGDPTYYPKRTPEDGAIHWGAPTQDIYNLVRAVADPYPGAFTEYQGERVVIWEVIPFSDDFVFDADSGTIVRHFPTRDEFVVKTADGSLLVTDWEAEVFEPEAGAVFTSLGNPDRVDTDE